MVEGPPAREIPSTNLSTRARSIAPAASAAAASAGGAAAASAATGVSASAAYPSAAGAAGSASRAQAACEDGFEGEGDEGEERSREEEGGTERRRSGRKRRPSGEETAEAGRQAENAGKARPAVRAGLGAEAGARPDVAGCRPAEHAFVQSERFPILAGAARVVLRRAGAGQVVERAAEDPIAQDVAIMGKSQVQMPGLVDASRRGHLESGRRGEEEEAAIFACDALREGERPALFSSKLRLEAAPAFGHFDLHVGKRGPEGGSVQDWRVACHRVAFYESDMTVL